MSKQAGSQRVALYYRVSTTDQSTAMQRDDLRRYAKARGFTISQEFSDEGVSGAKAKRPGLDRLMDGARKRLFDVVLVWRFDRFARSTIHLLSALEEFRQLKVAFISYNENIDTTTPMGAAMFTIVSAIAELERSIIRERVTAGVRRSITSRAKEGKTWGRVPVERADPAVLVSVLSLKKEGLGCHRIGKQLGLSSRTVWQVLERAKRSAA
jgi:DNA invertase Pin-like site-specific DNA recombinase